MSLTPRQQAIRREATEINTKVTAGLIRAFDPCNRQICQFKPLSREMKVTACEPCQRYDAMMNYDLEAIIDDRDAMKELELAPM
jgi:hypothetical protein